jgi:iron complex outermembrane receptor protein
MYNTNLKINKSILLIMMAGWNLYAQGGKLSGFITDQETGEALIGANVFIAETGNGMSTDKNGYYVLQKISPGSYTLMVSYIGYATLKKEITFIT